MLFTYRQIQAGLNSYQTEIVHRYYPILSGYDHSLFGLIKQIFHNLSTAQYGHIATAYTAVVGVLSLFLYVTRMRHLPFINRLLCLTVACLLLPPTSYDYRLIHLYTPWALLVLFAVDTYRSGDLAVPGLKQVFVCFIVLMSQVGEIIYHTGSGGQPDQSDRSSLSALPRPSLPLPQFAGRCRQPRHGATTRSSQIAVRPRGIAEVFLKLQDWAFKEAPRESAQTENYKERDERQNHRDRVHRKRLRQQVVPDKQ